MYKGVCSVISLFTKWSFVRVITSLKLKIEKHFMKKSLYFFPYTKHTIWSYSAAKNISRNKTFFNGEGREETGITKEPLGCDAAKPKSE